MQTTSTFQRLRSNPVETECFVVWYSPGTLLWRTQLQRFLDGVFLKAHNVWGKCDARGAGGFGEFGSHSKEDAIQRAIHARANPNSPINDRKAMPATTPIWLLNPDLTSFTRVG